MSDRPATAYEALAELIELELAAVRERDLATLAALKRRRGSIVRALAPSPPREAAAALERCAQAQARVRAELERMREEILGELRSVRHGQRAVGGYAPARPMRERVSASA